MKRGCGVKRFLLMSGAALACLSAPLSSPGTGRWIQHAPTALPAAGVAARPTDVISIPETSGHWVWVVWYDFSTGQWDSSHAAPYAFSLGTVDFRAPEFNRWYLVMVYDIATQTFY